MSDSGAKVGGLVSAPAMEKSGRGGWALWAVYLGVSWTWCIGMFLPALLWRDFSAWSFVAFALPNIVGAAAMGLVMRSPDASRVFLERHRWACLAFSAVTIAFQTFFAAWVARIMGGALGGGGGGVGSLGWVLCVAAAVVGALTGERSRRLARPVALALWVVSLAVIAVTVVREHEAGLLPDVFNERGVLPITDLAPLAAVCLLGFVLCPYLDRTFHRARIETGGASVPAFGLGFGFFFAVMIAGTLLTAPVLIWITSPAGGAGGQAVGRLLIALFAAHTLPQLVYTCWVHGAEARNRSEGFGLGAAALVVGLVVALLCGDKLVTAYGWTSETRMWANPLYGGEVAYRCFMAFYGLVFPAYIAIVAWPVGSGGRAVTRQSLTLFAAVLLLAVWFYWAGFVERRTWSVAIGVGVVVVGAVVSAVLNKSLMRKHEV
jgi:hypothetical protein